MSSNLNDLRGDRMDTHKNAGASRQWSFVASSAFDADRSREDGPRCFGLRVVSQAAAARQFNTAPKTVANWVERFRVDGVDGQRDRSSRPLSLPGKHSLPRARRSRLCGDSATQPNRLPPRSAFPRRRSAESCVAWASTGFSLGAGRADPAL